MGASLLLSLLLLVSPSHAGDCRGLFEEMIELKTLQKKELPQINIDYRKFDWKPNAPIPSVFRPGIGEEVSAVSNANAALSNYTDSFVAGLIQGSVMDEGIKTILKRYNQQVHIDQEKLILHQLSEPAEFHLYRADGMGLQGFSYFEEKGFFSSKRESLMLVVPEIGMPDIQQGSINNSGRTSLAFARLINDLISVGFAAKYKNPSLEKVVVYAHSVINPFLIERLPKLGFKDVGTREVKDKTGGVVAIGHDFAFTVQFKD